MDKGIQEIMDIEKKSEEIIEKAKKKAVSIKEKSLKDNSELRSKLEAEIESKRELKLSSANKEIKKRREEIVKASETENSRLVAKADKNVGSAVDFIVGILKKTV